LKLASLSHQRGAIALVATVPAPGTLTVSGQGLRSTEANFLGARSTVLRLRLNRAGKRGLARSKSGRLLTRVRVAFAPSSGEPASVLVKTLTFKLSGGKNK
jgi:hypothetical protein